jgi:hypothetical protein
MHPNISFKHPAYHILCVTITLLWQARLDIQAKPIERGSPIEKNGTPASPATALASSVLPVPAGARGVAQGGGTRVGARKGTRCTSWHDDAILKPGFFVG